MAEAQGLELARLLESFRDAESPPNEDPNGRFQRLIFQRKALAPVTNAPGFVGHGLYVKKVEDLGDAKPRLDGGRLAGHTNGVGGW
jgi:hypothetical protein